MRSECIWRWEGLREGSTGMWNEFCGRGYGLGEALKKDIDNEKDFVNGAVLPGRLLCSERIFVCKFKNGTCIFSASMLESVYKSRYARVLEREKGRSFKYILYLYERWNSQQFYICIIWKRTHTEDYIYIYTHTWGFVLLPHPVLSRPTLLSQTFLLKIRACLQATTKVYFCSQTKL